MDVIYNFESPQLQLTICCALAVWARVLRGNITIFIFIFLAAISHLPTDL